ncbi:MAG: hypothetical protein AB2L11_00940 [Syntrophobacteraceae bacterium]
MKNSFRVLLVATLIFFVQRQPFSSAYDDEIVHRNVNQAAAYKSSLDTFMKHQLGLTSGVNTSFQERKAWEWLREGGKLEDRYPRWLQHFHDPLKSWDSAGLDLPLLSPELSSLVWAQLSDDPQGDPHNEFSWTAARKSYYRALKTGSEADWALTFRILGQVMHLVSDAAVPAHVRNDPHYPGDPDRYEAWAAANGQMGPAPEFISKLNYKNPYPVDTYLFNGAVPSILAPAPISGLWDRDVYIPGGLPSESFVGLAEYTNAYFFSSSTLFSDDYPYPCFSDTDYLSIDWFNPDYVDAADGKIDRKIYLRHTAAQSPYRLATASYWLKDCLPPGDCWRYTWFLDNKVHEDYASLLIPRAVGYSAALLDYFFRDTIEIVPGPDGIYAFYNPNDPAGDNGGFQTVTLKLRNKSEYTSEEMTYGTIELIIKYRVATSNPFVSADVPSEPRPNIVAPARIVGSPILRDEFVELVFDLPQVIPKEATDLYLQVVYRGFIGSETDGVAMGFKDISEPTPYDIFNNMDWVCINGLWKAAGSQEAVALADANGNGIVDSNEWDIFPHNLNNLDVRFSPYDAPLFPPPAHFSVTTLGPAQTYRVYVLSDTYFGSGVSTCSNSPTSSYGCDHSGHGGFLGTTRAYPGLKRQTDWYYTPEECAAHGRSYSPCDVPSVPLFSTFRGNAYWALRIHNMIFPLGSAACSYASVPAEPPQPGPNPCTGQ